jgi:hypothetical protein
MERLGLNPVRPIRAPGQASKKKFCTVYDKQRKLLASLREAAAATVRGSKAGKEQLCKERGPECKNLGRRLRAAILAGEPVSGWWKPARRAAALRDRQQQAHMARERAKGDLQQQVADDGACDVEAVGAWDGASGKVAIRCKQAAEADAFRDKGGGLGRDGSKQGSSGQHQGSSNADDVDAFLDGLLIEARAGAPANAGIHRRADSPELITTSAGSVDGRGAHRASGGVPAEEEAAAASRPATARTNSGGGGACAGHGRRVRPAWAMTEADAQVAAELQEQQQQEELLSFAEGLDWEEFVGRLDDAQVAQAFEVRALGRPKRQHAGSGPRLAPRAHTCRRSHCTFRALLCFPKAASRHTVRAYHTQARIISSLP